MKKAIVVLSTFFLCTGTVGCSLNSSISAKSNGAVVETIEKKATLHSQQSDITQGNTENNADISMSKEDSNDPKVADDEGKVYDSFLSLYSAIVKDNEVVETKGFYESDDGGASKYTITSEASEYGLDLHNGYFAIPVIENDTINIKAVGAYADGESDDSELINLVINSGVKNVFFPKGEYACNNFIKLKTDGVRIFGDESTIITNNNFDAEYFEWFFTIASNDITIENMKLECRETIKPSYKSQVGIMYAQNIKISNCSFIIPETVLSDYPSREVEYTNLDIYTSWHNVTVDNCYFYDMADALAGGCLEIRDLKGNGSSNAAFTNNICYQNGRDEIIGVFSNIGAVSENNTLTDVTITDNEFHQSVGDKYTRHVGLSLGYEDAKGADNVIFKNNYVELFADFEYIKLGSSKNVQIENNTIICNFEKKDSEVFVFRAGQAEGVSVKKNTITVNDGEGKFGGISRGTINFEDNDITIGKNCNSIVFDAGASLNNNRITFNRSSKQALICNAYTCIGNTFTIDCSDKNPFFWIYYSDSELSDDAHIKNNTIKCTNTNKVSSLFRYGGLNLNGHSIFIENNIVEEEKSAITGSEYTGKISSDPKFVVNNNNFGSFTKKAGFY